MSLISARSRGSASRKRAAVHPRGRDVQNSAPRRAAPGRKIACYLPAVEGRAFKTGVGDVLSQDLATNNDDGGNCQRNYESDVKRFVLLIHRTPGAYKRNTRQTCIVRVSSRRISGTQRPLSLRVQERLPSSNPLAWVPDEAQRAAVPSTRPRLPEGQRWCVAGQLRSGTSSAHQLGPCGRVPPGRARQFLLSPRRKILWRRVPCPTFCQLSMFCAYEKGYLCLARRQMVLCGACHGRLQALTPCAIGQGARQLRAILKAPI